jgi:hypothetical protein
MFKGSAQEKTAMFEFLANLPEQVNSSSIFVATTIHAGKTFVNKLKQLEKKQHEAKRLKESAAASGDVKDEEEEEEDAKPQLSWEPFIPADYVELLDCKKLIRWSDGEITQDEEEERSHKKASTPTEDLKKISEACLKLDREFEKDEWDNFTANENWKGFFVKCPEEKPNAGEDFARTLLGILDKGSKLDVVITEMADSRQTLWPQRYYYEGHVSKSKLAMVKRATNLVKAPAKKNSLCEVKFHCEDRAWYWPPIALVGRSKANPEYLVGLLYVTHDQEHLHHGK